MSCKIEPQKNWKKPGFLSDLIEAKIILIPYHFRDEIQIYLILTCKSKADNGLVEVPGTCKEQDWGIMEEVWKRSIRKGYNCS